MAVRIATWLQTKGPPVPSGHAVEGSHRPALFSHRFANLMVVSDLGSRTGATMSAQVRLDAVIVTAGRLLASRDIGFDHPLPGVPCVAVIKVAVRATSRSAGRLRLRRLSVLSWTDATVLGCQTSPRIRQKIANATEDAVLCVSSRPHQKGCSSTERRLFLGWSRARPNTGRDIGSGATRIRIDALMFVKGVG
jgi:hypothetical protein